MYYVKACVVSEFDLLCLDGRGYPMIWSPIEQWNKLACRQCCPVGITKLIVYFCCLIGFHFAIRTAIVAELAPFTLISIEISWYFQLMLWCLCCKLRQQYSLLVLARCAWRCAIKDLMIITYAVLGTDHYNLHWSNWSIGLCYSNKHACQVWISLYVWMLVSATVDLKSTRQLIDYTVMFGLGILFFVFFVCVSQRTLMLLWQKGIHN